MQMGLLAQWSCTELGYRARDWRQVTVEGVGIASMATNPNHNASPRVRSVGYREDTVATEHIYGDPPAQRMESG